MLLDFGLSNSSIIATILLMLSMSCCVSTSLYDKYPHLRRINHQYPSTEPEQTTEEPTTQTNPFYNNEYNRIYKKSNDHYYRIIYPGYYREEMFTTTKEPRFDWRPYVRLSSSTTTTTETTSTSLSSTSTSTIPPSTTVASTTPKMDVPLALYVTTDATRNLRHRTIDPIKIYGIPKELLPILPGGGSRFDDVEREKIEKKKMSQIKGNDDDSAENAGTHEAEGLYSSGSLTPVYLFAYSLLSFLLINRLALYS